MKLKLKKQEKKRLSKAPSTDSSDEEGCSDREERDGKEKRKFKRYDPRGLRPGLNMGTPPVGYCYLWVGNFRRWQRRFFVLDRPGVVLYYKRANRKGNVWSINLKGASVVVTGSHQRQLIIVSGSVLYFIRTLHQDYRLGWVECIQKSIAAFDAAVAMAGQHSSSMSPHMKSERPSFSQQLMDLKKEQVEERVRSAMASLHTEQQEFLAELSKVQHGLKLLAGALSIPGLEPMSATVNSAAAPKAGSSAPGSHPHSPTHSATSKQTQSMMEPLQALSVPECEEVSPVFGSSLPERSSVSWQSKQVSGMGRLLAESKAKERRSSLGEESRRSSIESEMVNAARSRSSGHDCRSDIRLTAQGWPVEAPASHASGARASARARDTPPNEQGPKSAGDGAWRVSHTSNRSVPSATTSNAHKSPGIVSRNSTETSFGESFRGVGETDQQTHTADTTWGNLPQAAGLEGMGSLGLAWEKLQAATRACLQREIERNMEIEFENNELSESINVVSRESDRRITRKNSALHVADGENPQGLPEDDFDSETESEFETSSISNSMKRSEGEDEFFEAIEVLNQHEYFLNHSDGIPIEAGLDAKDEAEDGSEEDEGEEDEDEEGDRPRSALPVPSPLTTGFNVWNLIKNSLGRDLSSISLPVSVNEPMSGLQRGVEELEYYDVLEEALQCNTSLERLLRLCMFVISPYSGAQMRTHKPFNPFLGETFEWVHEGHYRIVLEQVCNNPSISAWHVESLLKERKYTMYGEMEFRNKFWGKTADLIPVGSVHLDVPELNEHFSWNKIRLSVHNLIGGNLWCNLHGDITVHNHVTKEYAKIKIIRGATKETTGDVEGSVYNADKNLVYTFDGNHMRGIHARLDPSANARGLAAPLANSLIYTPNPRPSDSHRQYFFTKFAIALNELADKHIETLPPTDSRFRPDMRFLEEGNHAAATEEKLRLEDKQRRARKMRKELNQKYQPLWFSNKKHTHVVNPYAMDPELDTAWHFNGKYWPLKEKSDWEECPDIF